MKTANPKRSTGVMQETSTEPSGQLTPEEVRAIALSIGQLAVRATRLRQRLIALEATAQAPSRSTRCSTRVSRSSTRSRSS
jgi:hypothetical protein